ncbi:MAG: dihydrofolate reductase, partial [Salegentibacter mishustinae]|nr:dihydrofolate reductase [Salegentibacter mishustinae]
MKHKFGILLLALASIFISCNDQEKQANNNQEQTETTKNSSVKVDEFADIKILRYEIPGWENLDLKEQK